jgi:NAD(P)-dependent dehydrogenase (short-subunit alcohol dehydrogenase family)
MPGESPAPDLPLDGHVVAITGASRGIGQAMSRAAAAAGARVAMLARTSAHLDEAAAGIPGALAVPVDLTFSSEIYAAFAKIDREFGRLDVLVNNAAMASAALVEDVEDEEVLAQLKTNFLAAVFCARSAIPLMRRTGGGAIVNVSSESAQDPFPYLSVYGASKAALEAWTRALAHELQPDAIRVALLISGVTNTGGFSSRWDPAVRAAAIERWEEGGYLARVAGRTPQEPEDVAEALVFVLTRPAASMIDVISCRAAR